MEIGRPTSTTCIKIPLIKPDTGNGPLGSGKAEFGTTIRFMNRKMEIPYTVAARPDTGLWNAKIGIWLFLASEVMLFGGLFSGYIFLRLDADLFEWATYFPEIELNSRARILAHARRTYVCR